MAETMVCVRLKPVAPRAGHVLRTFSYSGILFGAGKGWSRVSERVADYLRTVRQRERDPHSPLAFDVCSEEEARRLDARELELSTAAMPVDRAPVLVARGEQTASSLASAPDRDRARFPGTAEDGAATPSTPDVAKDRPSARAKH